ncbi:MAG: NAD(+) diphosphatase [Proteobacteria bacterium]|nr:NAD(+) diphosphatase [Pseudomonadota bacterium]
MPGALPDDARVYAYAGSRIVVAGSEDAPRIPTWREWKAAGADGAVHGLGALGGTPCVAVTLRDDEVPAGMHASGLRALFFRIPDVDVSLAGRASQVVEWDRTHRYCGRCGTPMLDQPGERSRKCPACGFTAWPRVSPAMMALVTRGRELLLARSRRFANTSMYSALAGFVEAGETVEDCVVREVREEVGLEVGALRYFGSQSWPFPHSLMIAFTAEYAGGDIRLDDDEIVDAQWFAPDALPPMPPSVSIARRLIEATAARLRAA